MMCNCQMKKADTKIEIKIRVMAEHRDAWVAEKFCKPCADAFIESGMGRAL